MSCTTAVNLGCVSAFEDSSSVDFKENETELPFLAITGTEFKKKSKPLTRS